MEGRRTQSERRAESRKRLIEAAIEVLGTSGYAKATLAEIGKAAGLSRGLVTHHFGSKEACMQAVITAIRQDVAGEMARVGAAKRGLGALDLLVDLYFTAVKLHSAGARAMYVVLTEAFTASPGLQAAVAESNEIVRGLIAGWIREGIEDGDVPADSDVKTHAVLVEAMLRGVSLQWLADPSRVDLQAVGGAAKRAVRAQLSAGATSPV
ncbi:MAG: TetR/AcrR family transcriptional regulator [Sciscionella sp.]